MSDLPSTSVSSSNAKSQPSFKARRSVTLKNRKESGAVDFLPFVGPHDRRLSKNRPQAATTIAASSSQRGLGSAVPSKTVVLRSEPYSSVPFSEDTVFELNSMKQQHISPAAEDTSNWALQKALQAIIVTSVASGVGEFLFARSSVGNNNNPFAVNNTKSRPKSSSSSMGASAASHGEHLVLSKNGNAATRPALLFSAAANSLPAQQQARTSQISLAALSTSALFGTKVYLDNRQVPSLFSSILAGAASGTIMGAANVLSQSQNNTRSTAAISSSVLSATIARHAIAVTCYFATYDTAMALAPTSSTNHHSNGHSTPVVLTAGALAGCVHSSLLMLMSTSSGGDVVIGTANGMGMRCMSTCLRAAPTHALVFWGYESLRKNVTAVPYE